MPADPRTALTGSQGSLPRARSGIVCGYVLRLIREHLDLTQEQLAQHLAVSLDTIAAWETGRRPLTAIPVGQMLMHRHVLLNLGATPNLLAALDRAMEADVLLASALDEQPTAASPLGAWVMQRDLADMLTWPLHGRAPEAVTVPAARPRRGPVAAGPSLGSQERTRFFTSVRATVEQARQPGQFLLRRQALYLAGYDRNPDTADWVAEQERETKPGDWLQRWLTARSVTSVGARRGDHDRVASFVRTAVADDDRSEAANLNYWAYWVGETSTIHLDDAFIATGQPGDWTGRRLLQHLVDRLEPRFGYRELYIHTLWALIAARPQLLQSTDRTVLRERAEILLDSGVISARAGRELDGVRYALRLAQG
ncbi:helix-turn-helix transcriptional regulator [Streptacidiphilus anmyonensis]|uniref:helix-turn-helix transcriptional regulator n=1 Tax=Streptacidiphilus anmyonensis TaxID=405782 RepID=UPI0005AA3CE5|nr:helix-turn-helix transcriptional regulator [Streptacidiphilus anmyonensis]